MDEWDAKYEEELDRSIEKALDYLNIDLEAAEKNLEDAFLMMHDIKNRMDRTSEDIMYLGELLELLQANLGIEKETPWQKKN